MKKILTLVTPLLQSGLALGYFVKSLMWNGARRAIHQILKLMITTIQLIPLFISNPGFKHTIVLFEPNRHCNGVAGITLDDGKCLNDYQIKVNTTKAAFTGNTLEPIKAILGAASSAEMTCRSEGFQAWRRMCTPTSAR